LPLVVRVEDDSASVGSEGCQQTILRQMYRQLDQLLVHLLNGLVIPLIKESFQGVRHIIIVNIHGAILIILHFPEVNGVLVVNVLQDVDLVLESVVFLGVLVVNPLLYQDLPGCCVLLVELAKRELAGLHVDCCVLWHWGFIDLTIGLFIITFPV